MAADIVPMKGEGVSGVARLLLKDDAYDKIRSLLLSEASEAGYSERALAARLSLGLGPVR